MNKAAHNGHGVLLPEMRGLVEVRALKTFSIGAQLIEPGAVIVVSRARADYLKICNSWSCYESIRERGGKLWPSASRPRSPVVYLSIDAADIRRAAHSRMRSKTLSFTTGPSCLLSHSARSVQPR